MLTVFLPLAAFLSVPAALDAPEAPAALDAPAVPAALDAEAPVLAARAFADAERVLAVRAIPGAVVFDLDRAGDQFQLTLSLDDDGAVVDTALAWVGPGALTSGVGPAARTGGVAPGAAARLDRLDRIDITADGAAVILVGGATAARLPIAAAD